MVTADDLKTINDALKKGCDVRIQRTPDGYRIVADKVTVLKRCVRQGAKNGAFCNSEKR